MLVHFRRLGLGNQIFIYAFLQTIRRDNERIILSGFSALKDVLEVGDILNIDETSKIKRGVIFYIAQPILCFLAKKNIISSISIEHEQVLAKYKREKTSYRKQKGLFSSIVFVQDIYAQSEKMFDAAKIEPLKIAEKYVRSAESFLQHIPKSSHKVFVHIRRNEYKNAYQVFGKSALLPTRYYKNQIQWFKDNKPNSFFVFLSDEPDFVKQEFKELDNKIISENHHFGVDFAIMTLCDSGILSCSSFSWWGSYLMQKRDIIFAPKYWLGFKSKQNHHSDPLPSYATEVEV